MNQQSKISKIAFVKAGWHANIVNKCLEGFNEELEQSGQSTSVQVFDVPGAYDIPLLDKKLGQSGRFDAIVASAFVVDVGIYRHDFVSATVVQAMMDTQLETGVPILSAVLTPHNFQETDAHITFFKEHFVIKGHEAARACLQVIGTLEMAA
ncbi:MAG: 6,7-dimethyl-8-ribityllumazine synthase [Pseudomonadota bacterium]